MNGGFTGSVCGQGGGEGTIILESYGFPGNRSVAKLFRKIPAGQCSMAFLSDLKELLNRQHSATLKTLRHVKVINHMLIKVLLFTELQPHIKGSFLEQISCTSQSDTFDHHFDQILEMRQTLVTEVPAGLKITPLRHIDDLEFLHWELISWLRNGNSYLRLKNLSFPPPPFKRFEGYNRNKKLVAIVPLETGYALWQEGRDMHHCIASYSSKILTDNGRCYVYHLDSTGGEQATMLLEQFGDVWKISEIRGVCNADISAEMFRFASSWLEEQDSGKLTQDIAIAVGS